MNPNKKHQMKVKQNKQTKLLIVDGENLLHRSFHKFEAFKYKGEPTGAIYGFMKSLQSNIFRFNPDHVIITFDNGRSKFRLKILPTYKGSRTKLGMDYESLQSQKSTIRRLLKLLNIPVIYDAPFKNHYESDDYIAWVARYYPGKVHILSSDKDFCQLIDARVKIISPAKETIITVNNCLEIMGYMPNECVDYLSLIGDTSDNIPGVKGIGPKKARQFLDTHKSIRRFINLGEGMGAVISSDFIKAADVGEELIDLNYFIDKHPLLETDIPIRYGKTINTKRLKLLLNEYGLVSLQSSEFMEVFKKLKVWKLKEN